MVRLPSGTVTFLFTDIEGSTRLWEHESGAMRPALERHDSLVRTAIEAHAGVIFKAIGDAFCAAFSTASEALAAAIDAQRAMHTEAWPEGVELRARFALHTGAAEERDGDYFGQPLNRVARLLATGHGGQTLLSEVTRGLTVDALPPATALEDLGEHRLKDLGRPERIFQICHPSLPNDFPPLRTLDTFPNNLSQQLTSFIGRDREITEVQTLMKLTRLLAILGGGGSGKSRLTLQVAADLLDQFADGVWLVELAPLADPALVPQAVTEALNIREEAGRTRTRTLVAALKEKRLLLVLDNCEHVVGACATLVTELLRACPDIHVLASSREALSVSGEQTYRIPPLSLPDPKRRHTMQSLSQYEAVHLFIERAKLVQPDFAVTDANAPALAQICHRLDGIPLAIELAAARVRSLSAEQIMTRLDDRFRLLTGGSRTALPRQQTLRALIDWSYDLLTEPERTLLRGLSVFSGGWTLAAAEVVCSGEIPGGGSLEEWEVLDLLSSLVDKSLVIYDALQGCDARYRMLETMRQYGQDRLRESGEGDAVRRRHADWFRALAEEASPKLREADQAAWLERLEAENDNLRTALEWFLSGEENAEAALRLAGSVWRFWDVHGHWSEGRSWFERALAASGPVKPTLRGRGLCAAGYLAYFHGDYAYVTQVAEEGLALSRATGDGRREGAALVLLGLAAYDKGDLTAAAECGERSLALFREAHDPWQTCVAMHLLGRAVMLQGDLTRAASLLEESLALMRQIQEPTGLGYALWSLGEVRRRQENGEDARMYYRECLTQFCRVAERRGVAHALEGLAKVASSPVLAAELFGTAQALRDEVEAAIEPTGRDDHAAHLARIRETLGEESFLAAWSDGQNRPWDQVVTQALAGV